MTSSTSKSETLSLIKEAAYDLQIGPTEISYSNSEPAMCCVKFEDRRGTEREIFVPVASTYRWIHDTLKFAHS